MSPLPNVQSLGYLHRTCPNCRSDRSRSEVECSVPAETVPIALLTDYWTGLFKEKRFFSYHRCEECGQMFAPAFFTQRHLEALYASMAPNMEDVTEGAIHATQRGYFHVARHGAALEGGYLEIGADVGHIVRHAARDGDFDHFWLVEPNLEVHAALAQATGGRPHTIVADMEDLSSVPNDSIGLAVMIHVLDHLLEPARLLGDIYRKLRPGGRLVIVTHNERSLLRRFLGKSWPPFCLQHPQLYNPRSIRAQLERTGFERVKVRRSRNVFPLDFLIRQAAFAGAGVDLGSAPLPKIEVGLKLGNMITVADRPR